MNEKEIISKYIKRRNDMRSARQYRESERDISDAQVDAKTFYDNYGKLNVNVPLEQNLIELYLGRQSNRFIFNIEPDGKEPEEHEVQTAKYILDFYLENGNFYEHVRRFDIEKAIYGTGIFYTGLTYNVNKKYEIKKNKNNKDNKKNDQTKDYNSNYRINTNYSEITEEKRIFTPVNVPIRNFWIDDTALYQPYFSVAKDCIMQEEISLDELENRRGNNKYFKNIEQVKPISNLNPPYGKQNYSHNDNVIIHHYYDRINKDYFIVANYSILLFAGKQLYKHGKLPFVVCQHFPSRFLYGMGIPAKVRYIKAYNSALLQSMLDKVQASAGINIGLGGNTEIDGELKTEAGSINVRKFNNSIEQVKQFQLDSNISGLVGVLNLIDEYIAKDTGDNPKLHYQVQAPTLGQEEIVEENKAIKHKSIDSAKDIAMDEGLTHALNNIQQFAPKLLLTKKEIDGVTKVEYPTIRIPDIRIEKKKGKVVYIEDMGKYGYLEFKPDTIKNPLRVKVSTVSTRTALKSLEKNSITQYINSITQLVQIRPDILKKVDAEGLLDLIMLTYGYDSKLAVRSKRDEIMEENLEKIDSIKEMLGIKGENDLLNFENSMKMMGGKGGTQSGMEGQMVGGQMPMLQGENMDSTGFEDIF